MIMFDDRNYQPVMIRTLNQNNGKASKSKIIVKHSDKPVFYDDDFYHRSHGKTQKLTGPDVTNFINRMWPDLK